MFRKTLVAIAISGLLPSVASSSSIIVSPDSQPELINPSGSVDSITFETHGQNIEKTLGNNKDIPVLNVINGLRLQAEDGGGKTIMNISARQIMMGGVAFGSSTIAVGKPPLTGSTLNIEADSFRSEVGSKAALSAAGETFVNIGTSSNPVDQISLKTSDNDSAIYACDASAIAVYGNSIEVISASTNSSASPIYATEGSKIDLHASDRLKITNTTNTSDSTAVVVKQEGTISLSSNGALDITADIHSQSVRLEQSDNKKASIAIKGKNVNLVGNVKVEADQRNDLNKVSLNAENDLKITANDEFGAVAGWKNSFIDLNSDNFNIHNKNTGAKSNAIILGPRGARQASFIGNFIGNGTIEGETGVFVQDTQSRFILNGAAAGSSSVTLIGSLGGLVSRSYDGETSIKDSSVIVKVQRTDPFPYVWDTPTRKEGIVGIHSDAGALVSLSNREAAGKRLQISVDANVADVLASGLCAKSSSASATAGIAIDNFDTLSINVKNVGSEKGTYGIRTVSSKVLGTHIGSLDVVASNGTALFSSSHSSVATKGLIDLDAETIQLQGTEALGIGIDAIDEGRVSLAARDGLIISGVDKAIKVASSGSEVDINAPTARGFISGDWLVKEGKVKARLGSINIDGILTAEGGGTVDVTGGKTVLKGATNLGGSHDGIVNLNFGQNSVWYLTDNSEATGLIMNDAAINFSRWSPTTDTSRMGETYRSLTTSAWSGENNTLLMKIDLGHEDASNVLTDRFIVGNAAIGSHIADIQIDGRELVPEKFHSVNWLVSQGTGSDMTITNKDGTNQFGGNGMVTTWALGFVPDGQEGKLNSADGLAELAGNTTGVGVGKWYLIRNDESTVVPGEVEQVKNLGISTAQAMSFASELEDLRTRLGEVRYGAQDGAWVRAGYAKERADGYQGRGFEQKTQDIHIGLDRLVGTNESSSWLIGGALRYAKSEQKGFSAARGGEGDLEQYSAKLYATYMHTRGSYADFVLQAGRYSQDLTGMANDSSSAFTASYKTYGYGASIEVGHMFDFNNRVDDRRWFNHSFVEPQLQLSYFDAHGKDYETSTGMAVSQGDADFLTGRAGLVVGQKFNYGNPDGLDRRYVQFGIKGGVKYQFLGDQKIRITGVEGITKEYKADDVKGARYYYGVTSDWQLGDNFRAYASIEREEGDHYTKDFDVSVGLKYQFN